MIDWIREHVEPTGEPELAHDRPWAAVWRVPVADGVVWFKACAPVQALEPWLTAELAARHPTLMPDVIAHDDDRAWLLLGDLGTPIGIDDMTLDDYLELLPRYAELQQVEVAHADDQLAHGLPDLRPAGLPHGYDALASADLPLTAHEVKQLRDFAPRFRELCTELDAFAVPAAIQHDDLHGNNLFRHAGDIRILDWGDSSVAHPFFSFMQVFRHTPNEWHQPMLDAYADRWNAPPACARLAIQVGWFAYAVALLRERVVHPPANRERFDLQFASVLRDALRAL